MQPREIFDIVAGKVPVDDQTQDRYFALVVRVPGATAARELGGVLSASTVLGNLFRDHVAEFAPEDTRITRSIEITREMAVNGIR